MKRALINVDYTYDFVADDGKLTCGLPGQAIEAKIVEITKEFINNNEYVAFGIDAHELDDPLHPETASFPEHNIVGTPGIELYGELRNLYEENKSNKNVFYFEKTRYSAFVGTNLELKLRERQIEEVYLVGVCTDICILHTAIDAYNKGFKIVIPKDAVASFDEGAHQWALEHFKKILGATII